MGYLGFWDEGESNSLQISTYQRCFLGFKDAKDISTNRKQCISTALRHFGHSGKICAIANAAEKTDHEGFSHLKARIKAKPLQVLQEFNFIGPITVFHIAKNLGLPVAKPDRHLVRIAATFDYPDVQKFCKEISKLSGGSVPVVDIVLWRFATIEPRYLEVLQ